MKLSELPDELDEAAAKVVSSPSTVNLLLGAAAGERAGRGPKKTAARGRRDTARPVYGPLKGFAIDGPGGRDRKPEGFRSPQKSPASEVAASRPR